MFVKDMTTLGRNVKNVVIVDNSPCSFFFQPQNAIPIESWYEDVNDKELYTLTGFLNELRVQDEVLTMLAKY
jgi:TFIIF-interacting CTD phosphatase-like protein